MEIAVTQFKAHCLGIIGEVEKSKCTVVVKRHGRPVAMIVPMANGSESSAWGRAAATTRIKGDLFSTGEAWDAE